MASRSKAYCASLACLPISLWTGNTPTLRTYQRISLHFMGVTTFEESTNHIDNLHRFTSAVKA